MPAKEHKGGKYILCTDFLSLACTTFIWGGRGIQLYMRGPLLFASMALTSMVHYGN